MYAGNRRIGYVSLTRGYWYASWDVPGLKWAYRGGPRTFFSGCEGESDENRNGVALRLTPSRWNIATFPDFHHLGALTWDHPGRWAIVDARGRQIGHTEDRTGSRPDSPAEALLAPARLLKLAAAPRRNKLRTWRFAEQQQS